MMRFRSIALFLLATLVVLAAGCGGGDSDVPAGAIAVVDGHEVSKASYDRTLEQAKKGYGQSGRTFPKQGTPEYQTIKTNAVNYLVEKLQFELAAEDLGVKIDEADVTKRLNELKQQYHLTEKTYQQQLKAAGKTDADVREDVKNNLLQEGVAAKLTEDIKITDDDIQKYYTEHKKEFQTAASRDIRHILVSVCGAKATNVPAKGCLSEAKAKSRANELHTRLQHGASFTTLAKKYSTDPGSKDTGGKLTISKGSTVPEFDKVAFSLPVHTLSQPVKTQYGYHLIEALSSIRPATTTPLKQVRAQIRTQLENQKRTEALSQWVEKTKDKYADKTEYQVGFAPPKSSTQTVSR